MLYILLFTFLSAWIDAEHLEDNDYIESHVSRWLLRALFVIAVGNTYQEYIGMTLVFTALFDVILNYLTGRKLLYLGKTAYWDIFWRKIPFLYIIFKVVSLFVGIFLLLC